MADVVVAVVSNAGTAARLIGRWASDRDRAESRTNLSLLGRAALRALLARETGGVDWQVLRAPSGKPYILTPSGMPGPSVSVSHTGTTVAVAVAQTGALGIDIEQHRSRDFGALAAQAFGPAQQAAVAASGADAFYRIWTLREAMAKATGEGLALAANGRDLVPPSACGPLRWTDHGGRAWYLAHARIEPAISLAIAHADVAGDVWSLRWSNLGAASAVIAEQTIAILQ